MNVAKIHDRLHISTFWEKKIAGDSQHADSEEQRKRRSALKKLRGEWSVRLDNRTKHLTKLNDKVKKVKAESAPDEL
ncbi:protein FAM240B [Cyclopterus lumpus]|uniref:protein FAM240B n=1 Tax=Cyclopterus lumpus TaxID=8103 RepID=UPI001485E584|nr:protein FAM240B [Cyclopterus lumpus]